VKLYVRPSILLISRELSPLGVNKGVKISPRRQISPLGARVEVKNGPMEVKGDFTGRNVLEFLLC
jgi:hypothetical protein